MKFQDALEIINKKPKGFMVHFEWIKDGILQSDFFPDKHEGETLIETAVEAQDLLIKFAENTKGKTCNLYVIDSEFRPITDYILKNR
jgi:hypothetical protein